MTAADRARQRWRAEVRRALPSAEDDFVEELTEHVAQSWLAARAHDRSEADADAIARLELHAWRGVRPPARPAPRAPFLGMGLDWRFAWRMLRWRPSFAVGATALSAIAVATASLIVAVLNGVLIRPLPYPQADRLVTIWQGTQDGQGQVSYPDFVDLRATGVFDIATAFSGGTGTFSGGVSVERVNALFVAPEMFTLLGAVPVKGRLLTEADAAAPVALISHRLWHSQFGGDEAIIGRTFSLSGQSATIVGVLPAGFDFELPVARTFLLANHDVWRPFDTSEPFTTRRDVSTYQVLARLSPGVTLRQAATAVAATGASLAQQHPATNRDRGFTVTPLKDVVVASARQPLGIAALGGTILVLAALANLTGLALARVAPRLSELTVRRALGASRFHLMRQMVVEHLPIVVIGGVLGVLSTRAAIAAIATATTVRLPRPDALAFDTPVWMAAIGVAIVTGFVLSVLPIALTRRHGNGGGSTRIAGSASRRPRRLLVASEISLALVLCSAAALVSITLISLLRVDAGFATTGRLTFRVSAYAAQHPGKAETTTFYSRLLDRIAALPGVAHVAAGSSLPLSGQFSGVGVLAQGRGQAPADHTLAGWQFVTPGFFAATGTPLLRGRDFLPEEQARDAHVTIINAALARALFGDADAIGQRIQSGGGDDWHEVIGVAADVRHRSLREAPSPRVYDLAGQHWGRTLYVVVASASGETGHLRDAVIGAVADTDAGAPVFEVATVAALVTRAVGPERLAALAATAVGVVALLLAALGVHAIVACSVAERRREMGVRLALGATPRQVMQLVLSEAGLMALAGGVAGLVLAGGAARMLASYLHGVDAGSVWPIILLIGSAVAVAAASAAVPAARRAAGVDPARVLQDPTA